jgi:RNA polymerase sigma factor (sigma-70 family)
MNHQANIFESLFLEYKHYIKALIHKFNGQYGSLFTIEDIQELEQDCWLKIFKITGDTVTINHPKSYLFIIVRNSFIDHCKKLSKNNSFSVVPYDEFIMNVEGMKDTSTDPDMIINKMSDDQYISEIKEIIKKLPKKKQLIFKLRYFDDCTQTETAKSLKISQSTVSEHEAYVLKYLKDELIKKLGNYN